MYCFTYKWGLICMIRKELELRAFEILYNVDKGFFDSDKMVININITNDLRPDWVYANGQPCVVGFLQGNMITMLLAESDDDQEFKDNVSNFIKSMPIDYYSVNKDFETGILKSFFNLQYIEVKEIKPFFGRFWNRDKFFNELIKEKVIPPLIIEDPLKNDEAKCPDKWLEYQNGNEQALLDIGGHNLHCLLKASLILKNKPFFLDNYNINKKGWLVGVGKKQQTYEGKLVNIYNRDSNAIMVIEFNDKDNVKHKIELRSYYKMIEGKALFYEGSNMMKYKWFYGKEPEVGDIVKVESDTKGKNFHVLL